MIRKIFIMFSVLNIGCVALAQQSSEKVFPIRYPQSVTYNVPQFDPQEIGRVVSYGIEELNMGRPKNNWTLMLTNQYILRPDKNGYVNFADGWTSPQGLQTIVFAYNECLADSSIFHELAHAMGYNHGDKEIEKKIQEVEQKAILDLCPPGYTPGTPPPPKLRKQ